MSFPVNRRFQLVQDSDMHETMSSSKITNAPPTGDLGEKQGLHPAPSHAPVMDPLAYPALHRTELRDVAPGDVARFLRAMLGLPPGQPAPGELAATVRRSMPAVVRGLDAGGWIAWCLAGMAVFTEGPRPLMSRVRAESKRLVVSVAMLRSAGNLSRAAKTLGTSRKVLRDNLRAAGLYPWLYVVTDGVGCDEAAPPCPDDAALVGKDDEIE